MLEKQAFGILERYSLLAMGSLDYLDYLDYLDSLERLMVCPVILDFLDPLDFRMVWALVVE
jgi:hypothetical protein